MEPKGLSQWKKQMERYVLRHTYPFKPRVNAYQSIGDMVWGTLAFNRCPPYLSPRDFFSYTKITTNRQQIASLVSKAKDLVIVAISVPKRYGVECIGLTPKEKFIATVADSQLPENLKEITIESATRSKHKYLVVCNSWCETMRHQRRAMHWHPVLKIYSLRDITWKYLMDFSSNQVIKRLHPRMSVEKLSSIFNDLPVERNVWKNERKKG
jgi:hypothetical protein